MHPVPKVLIQTHLGVPEEVHQGRRTASFLMLAEDETSDFMDRVRAAVNLSAAHAIWEVVNKVRVQKKSEEEAANAPLSPSEVTS